MSKSDSQLFNQMVNWFFFTVVASLIPFLFKFVICGMLGQKIAYSDIGSEVFFFDLIVTANGLKQLNEVENHPKFRKLLFLILMFFMIFLAAMYGILLLNDYKTLELNSDYMNGMYLVSYGFTAIILVLGGVIEWMGGIQQ